VSPDEIALVQRSFQALDADPDRLAGAFYERLFVLAPDARALFPDELAPQRRKLIDQLAAIVASLDDTPAVLAAAAELGRRHGDYGTRVAHYDAVGEALVGAVATCSPGGTLDAATLLAWRRAYRLLAETMMRGAAGG
jgi:nitric oxide dioxygenase